MGRGAWLTLGLLIAVLAGNAARAVAQAAVRGRADAGHICRRAGQLGFDGRFAGGGAAARRTGPGRPQRVVAQQVRVRTGRVLENQY